MIAHYLKVAFRNLWKYKTQHLVGSWQVARLNPAEEIKRE